MFDSCNSCAFDTIPIELLKKLPLLILTSIINDYIDTGVFTSRFKEATVRPLYVLNRKICRSGNTKELQIVSKFKLYYQRYCRKQ